MRKKIKTSIVLSSLVFGAVNLSAANPYIDNTTLEIDNNYQLNVFYLRNNAKLINIGSNNNRLDIEESTDSSVINNSELNITDNWTALNLKEINNSAIINNGNINIIGDGSSYININGIDVSNLIDSEVVNNGNIVANLNSDTTVNGIVVREAEGSSVRNTGLIDLTATGDDGYLQGIHLDGWFAAQNGGRSEFNSSEIINDKDIIVSSKGRLTSSYGISSWDVDINNSQIINNGKISVKAEGVYADSAGMELDNLTGSQIINAGTIEATSIMTESSQEDRFSEAIGILIETADDIKIENSGSILVNANSNNKEYSLANGISVEEFIDSKIENSGTIKATINNKLDKNALAIGIMETNSNATVTNTSSGKLYGNVVLNGISTLNNKGFISLPYNANKNAIFSGIDDYGQKVSVNLQPSIGNLVNSGTIEIGAFKNSNNVIENTQILTKTATFEKGSKMQVAVVEGSKAFVKGDTLSEVVTATDKLTINDLTLNQTKLADNSALLDFEYKVSSDNHKLDLVVSKVESIKGVVTKPDNGSNINVNAGSVGAVLDELRNNQDKYPNMGAVLSKLDSLSSNQDVKKAVNSLLAMTSTSLINTSSSINSSISGIVSNRLGNIKSGLNSGDEIVVDNNKLWAKAYGSLGKQDDKDGISGFDLKTYGLGLGYDKEYKDGQVFGLGGFYTNADVETNGINQENDVDAYSIVAYGSNVLKDDKTTIYYQTSHTWQKNDSKRELFTGENANAKFTSKTFAIESKVGHKIALGEKASIEPNIGISYKHFENPSYKENGAGALNIQSDKFTSSELLGKIGADFDYNLTGNSKLTANLGAGYDFHDSKNIITSSFAGANGVTFDSKGIDNGRWKYEAGIGYVIDINNSNNLSLDYNYQGEGSKFRNNVVSVNYNYKF
ncbi:autotransporter outer membrane beta-barrel domain-containing protein [Aliarcobacter butzleri]|uniref:autotransporter family protein n=1 Tax=Aliarcobacter butzleri TaxID=28197 RepID=UPI003B21E259